MFSVNGKIDMKKIDALFEDGELNETPSSKQALETKKLLGDYSADENELCSFDVEDDDDENDLPVKTKDDEDIENTSYDEQGNLYVQYKDKTSEMYIKEEDGNFSLYERTEEIPKGQKTEYYSKEGSVIADRLVHRDVDDKTGNLRVTVDYSSREHDDRYTSFYDYKNGEETPENFTGALVKGVYDGKEYEYQYDVNRDENSKVTSFEEKLKYPDGTAAYYRFDGQRGEMARDAMLKGEYFNGFFNEGIKYDENGNITERKVREISETGALLSSAEYDKDGNLKVKQSDYAMDDYIGTAYQGHTGDCYLLASLNSFAMGEDGQSILRKNVVEDTDENGQKVYTVNLPGAKIAAQSLKERLGDENVFIKDSYTITQDELDKANIDPEAFSDGDQNVLLYELVFDKYRKDVKATVEKNNINPSDTYNISGLEGYSDPNNPIEGGFGSEVKFILTGKKPEVWYRDVRNYHGGILLDSKTHTATVKDNVPYAPYSAADGDDDKQYISLSGFMQTADVDYSDEKLNKLLKQVIEDSKDGVIDENVVTVGLFVGYDDKGTYGPHEIAVVSMTEDEVVVVDSNDTTLGSARKYIIPMEEFKKGITSFDVMNLK